MAWPLDAVYQTFAAGTPVPSDFLNEAQDRIVDLHMSRDVAIPLSAGSGSDATFTHGTFEAWEADNTNAKITIPCVFGVTGCVISRIRVKYYILAAKGAQIYVESFDSKITADTTQPTITTEDTHDTTGDSGTPAYWAVADFTGLALTLTEGVHCQVYASFMDAGDRIAGVVVTFQPITPTP